MELPKFRDSLLSFLTYAVPVALGLIVSNLGWSAMILVILIMLACWAFWASKEESGVAIWASVIPALTMVLSFATGLVIRFWS